MREIWRILMDKYSSISQLTGITTEELNNMSKFDMIKIINRFAPIAERRRDTIVNFFDRNQIEPPTNYGYENKVGMRSWRLANFRASIADSAGKMKSKIRLLQKYLDSNSSTLSGIKRQEREMFYGLAKRAGVPTYTDKYGNIRINTLSKQYREFSNAISSLSSINGKGNSFAKRYEGSQIFWEIIDKVKEIYKDETRNASSRVQIATVQELQDISTKSITDIVFNIVDRLRGEYDRLQEIERRNAPKYTSTADFFEEEED